MIKNLADWQINLFPEYIERWTRIGLSTEPANRLEAEAGIKEMYHIGGLEEPRIVWTGSPMGNGLARVIMQSASIKTDITGIGKSIKNDVKHSVRAHVGDCVWASIRNSIGDNIWTNVRGNVRDSIEGNIRDSIWDGIENGIENGVKNDIRDSIWDNVRYGTRNSIEGNVRNNIWDGIENSVKNNVRDVVWNSVKNSIFGSIDDSGYGQHEAPWLSFYAYIREVLGLKQQTEKLSGIRRVAESAGWYLPHRSICWISERPNELILDERGRLHNMDGPALTYPDEWKIYSVHGVIVSDWIMEYPEDITVKLIDKERNIEVRRIMIDKMGRDKYIQKSGAKKVHSDEFGELFVRATRDGDRIMMVLVDNPTPEEDGSYRKYFLPVDPFAYGEVKTARAAVAQTWRRPDGSMVFDSPDDYAPDYAS